MHVVDSLDGPGRHGWGLALDLWLSVSQTVNVEL
jgi:hypothetical protein